MVSQIYSIDNSSIIRTSDNHKELPVKEAPKISARAKALFEERHGYGHEDEDVVQESGDQIREQHPDQGKDGNQKHHSPLDDLDFEGKVVGGYLTFCSFGFCASDRSFGQHSIFYAFPKIKHQWYH